MKRVLATFVALAALLGALTGAAPPALGAPGGPGAHEADARASRAQLLLRSAELTDRLEAAQAEVVAAQMRHGRARDVLARMQARMRTRAVRAYVRGPEPLALSVKGPRPYLEVAAAKERQLVSGFRSASADASAQRDRAEAARNELRRTSAQLARAQGQLDAVIAVADRRRDEEQRRDDEARMAALAQAQAEAVRFSEGPAGSPSPGGYAPRARDPGSLLARHKLATERQLAVMRFRFGPLAPGAPLPPGLQSTGQRLVGNASWYGPGFNGRPTASGAIYDQEGWTVASRELPLGTVLLVTRGDRRVVLLVNDRGPYVGDRVLDLSAAAARAVGLGGVGPVSAEVVGRA